MRVEVKQYWVLLPFSFSPMLVWYSHHIHRTESLSLKSGCPNILPVRCLQAGYGFRPAVRAVSLHGAGCASSRRMAVIQAEKTRRCAPVFPGHGVVQYGVDGGTQVEQNHGHQTAVLG